MRIEQAVPSREHAPGYESINQPRPFQGSNVGPTPPIVPGGGRAIGVRDWNVAYEGVTACDEGNPITPYDTTVLNSAIPGVGYSFPGTDSDDNSWYVWWQVPSNIDLTQPVYFTIEAIPE